MELGVAAIRDEIQLRLNNDQTKFTVFNLINSMTKCRDASMQIRQWRPVILKIVSVIGSGNQDNRTLSICLRARGHGHPTGEFNIRTAMLEGTSFAR
jgi:hypothetical protein